MNCNARSVRLARDTTASEAKHAVCSTDVLLQRMVFNQRNASPDIGDIVWQHFSSIYGAFVQFPAVQWASDGLGNCAMFDPRIQPWYVAASAGPRQIIILIDRSGSMSFPASTAGPASNRPVTTRLRLAQQSAHFLLSTLSHIDMVHVVSFADSSVRAPLANSDKAGLVRATEANKCRLHAFIDSIRAHGASNFTSGFEEATKILNASARSSCANAVVLFTDDTPDDRRSERSLLSSVQSLNTRTRATSFVIVTRAAALAARLRLLHGRAGPAATTANVSQEHGLLHWWHVAAHSVRQRDRSRAALLRRVLRACRCGRRFSPAKASLVRAVL